MQALQVKQVRLIQVSDTEGFIQPWKQAPSILMTPPRTRKIYLDITEADDMVIKMMTRKNYMTNKDYQNFFINILYNTARQQER